MRSIRAPPPQTENLPVPSSPDLDSLRGAIDDALARDDAARARKLLRAAAHALALEDGVRFRALVANLPDELWHGDLVLTTALGTSYRSAGSPPGGAALAYLRTAERLLASDPGLTPTEQVAVLTAHAAGLRSQGRLHDADRKLAEAGRLLDDDDHGPAFVQQSARHALGQGVVDLMLGRIGDARRHLEFAHGLAVHLTAPERVECLGVLALAAYAQGDLTATDRLIAEIAASEAPSRILRSGFAAGYHAARILVTTDRYDIEGLEGLAETMTAASVHTEWEPFAQVASAYAESVGGDHIAALDHLQLAQQRYLGWQPPGIGLHVGNLLRADILGILDRGDESYELLVGLDHHEGHALCPQRFMARLALWHGDLLGADAALAACEELGDAHSARTLIDVRLLRSAVQLERGDLAGSDVGFDRALHAMARTGVRSPFRLVPSALLDRLAERALGRAEPGSEVHRILTAVRARTQGISGGRESLSERERLVLAYVERRLTVAQLYISPNTVKTHLRRLYRKLGVATRDEAIRKARTLGLHLGSPGEITRESPVLRGTEPGDMVV